MTEDWTDNRLELAFRASREGIWDWDLEADTMYYSPRMLRFLGYAADEAPHLFKDRGSMMQFSSALAMAKELEKVLDDESDLFAAEPCVRNRNGNWRYFRIRGTAVRNEDGRLLRLVGSAIDISKRKKAEQALAEERSLMETLIENVPMNIYFKDRKSRFVMANTPTAQKMALKTVPQLLGKSDADFFAPKHANEARQQEIDIMESRTGQEGVIQSETWPGEEEKTWVVTTKQPWIGPDGSVKGTFGVTSDISDMVRAQQQQEELAARLQEVNKIAEEERSLLRLVIDNVPLNVYFKDLDHCFVVVNQAMATWMGLEEPKDLLGKRDRDFFSHKHWREAEAAELQILETGQPIEGVVERETWGGRRDTWVMTSKYPWRDPAGNILGTFGVSSDVTELVRAERDLEDRKIVLERQVEMMREELDLAREVQQALLPKSGAEFEYGGKVRVREAHLYRPASELSGDFFDVRQLGEERVCFLLSDVMGHGVRSALVVAMLRGLLEQIDASIAGPGEILTSMNDGLCHLLEESQVNLFATAVCGVVNLKKNTVSLALAGHPNPIAVFEDGTRQLSPPKNVKGPAMGLMDEVPYQEVTAPLAGLKRLFLFSDGILEVTNPNDDEFGIDRLVEAVERGGRLGKTLDRLARTAEEFAEGAGFGDDLCLLGLEFLPPAADS